MSEHSRVLVMPMGELRKICEQGETQYPHECCGLLLGRIREEQREVVEVVNIHNEQKTNRERRFLISPEQFIRAEKEAQDHGLELLGFYHSHPDHPPVPSDFDRENALPFYTYVIVSIRSGAYTELRSWQLDDDRSGYTEDRVIYEPK